MDNKWIAQLESEMKALFTEHQALHTTVKKKLEALAQARPALVRECCVLENQHVQAIGEIEKSRQRVVGRLTELLEPTAAKPLSLEQIAERVGEPARGRLLVWRTRLRSLMEEIRQDNAVARQATEGLMRHVQGMMQMITQAVNRTTYRPRTGGTNGGSAISSFSTTA